ncbi:MAG: DUF2090 domain-containing protein [Candidatus Magasanikbacteria bacterium]
MSIDNFKTQGKFLMLALDHRGSFKKIVNASAPGQVSDEEIIKVKGFIKDALSPYYSGILVDPKWGLKLFTPSDTYMLCIEASGYEQESDERITTLEYSVEQLKALGASSVKILLFFNPSVKSAGKQLKTAHHVLDDCKRVGLPFLLEIVVYGQHDELERQKMVVDSVRMFMADGLRPDVYKLEYPGTAENCAEITRLVDGIPWVILSQGITFDKFRDGLKVAMTNGASGFTVGRGIWQEIKDCSSDADKKEFLQNVVVPRFKEISDIVLSS